MNLRVSLRFAAFGCALCALGSLISVGLRRAVPPSHEAESPAASANDSGGSVVMREARRAVRGPSSEALHSDSAGDVFGTPEGLAAVRRAIIDAERVLRPDERAEVFRASALDTEENVQAARRRLAEPYPAEIGRSTAEQRVLALHLLSLSQHLAADDCFELLEHQLRAPEGSNSARTALLWDVLSLAKICGAKDGDRLRALRNGRAEGALDSQLDVALASLAEEHHK